MPTLRIEPEHVELVANQAQQFVAYLDDNPTTDVTWSVHPAEQSEQQKDNAYLAPSWVWNSKTVLMVATDKNDPSLTANATIDLKPIRFWTHFLGIYWLILVLVILVWLVNGWSELCPTCGVEEVEVYPPIVTLAPLQQQVFRANSPVAWSANTEPHGRYVAPANGDAASGKVAVVASTSSKPPRVGSAEVLLNPGGGLGIQPPHATVHAGDKHCIQLTAVLSGAAASTSVPPPPAPNLEWLAPNLGTMDTAGKFCATGVVVDRPTSTLVVVRTDETPPRVAGARVTILPKGDDGSPVSSGGIFWLIGLMGALGAVIHGLSSFTIYVGNRDLVASWTWWYLLKPFLGALVAIVFYTVYRGGLVEGNVDMTSADCFGIAALAALVGLFAELSTLKLRDIFETLFTPKRDTRQDRAGQGPEATAASLSSIDPSEVTVQQGGTVTPATVTLHGKNFRKGCKVKVGDQTLRPTFHSSTQLGLPLAAANLTAGQSVGVVVLNVPDKPSEEVQLTVK